MKTLKLIYVVLALIVFASCEKETDLVIDYETTSKAELSQAEKIEAEKITVMEDLQTDFFTALNGHREYHSLNDFVYNEETQEKAKETSLKMAVEKRYLSVAERTELKDGLKTSTGTNEVFLVTLTYDIEITAESLYYDIRRNHNGVLSNMYFNEIGLSLVEKENGNKYLTLIFVML